MQIVIFFNSLPSELQNVIIDTKTISGHGTLTAENVVSIDKVYLLSLHEVYDATESNSDIIYTSSTDSAYNQSRQLDYYKNNNVTLNNFTAAIKKYKYKSTEYNRWWLRTPSYDTKYPIKVWTFVSNDGKLAGWVANASAEGFSPAFRIG